MLHPAHPPKHAPRSPFAPNKDALVKSIFSPWLSYSSSDPNTSFPLRYLNVFFNASTTAAYPSYFDHLKTLPWYGVLGNHEYGWFNNGSSYQCGTTTKPEAIEICKCQALLANGTLTFEEMIASPSACQWSPLYEVDDSGSCPYNEGLNGTVPNRWHLRQGAWHMPVDVPSVGGNPLVDFIGIDTNPFIHKCDGV